MAPEEVNYECMPSDKQMDETDINLRSYFSRNSEEKLRQYNPDWSDEELIKWDENFTSEGNLFLVCSERDVDVTEYREVLEEHLRFRGIK